MRVKKNLNRNISNMELDETNTVKNKEKCISEFSFEMSILKGIKITSKGYDKEAVVLIIKNLFSPARSLFWVMLFKAGALVYLIIKHTNVVLGFIKIPL